MSFGMEGIWWCVFAIIEEVCKQDTTVQECVNLLQCVCQLMKQDTDAQECVFNLVGVFD